MKQNNVANATINLKEVLEKRTDLQHLLFRRSFFVSKETVNTDSFPFYGNWNHTEKYGYNFYVHKDNNFYFAESEHCCVFLIGHCYNPFTMEWKEGSQLQRIANVYGTASFQDRIDELTGVFALGWINKVTGEIQFEADPSGMQSFYYGIMPNGNFILTSHPQIAADIYNLTIDKFIQELISYRWYGFICGAYLPADLSAFKEIKRVVPNHLYSYDGIKVSHQRVYNWMDAQPRESMEECNEDLKKAADIMRCNLELISKKWNKPAISLTGGVDSNTTFAAANGNYPKFETFSFISAPKEIPDAEAAETIASHFGVHHTEFSIPGNNDDIKDFEIKKAIINHINSSAGARRDNEIRKRIFLEENLKCDVEVKSWVSETVRCSAHHRWGRKSMPKLSAKLCRNHYKVFLTNRKLAHKIDKIYKTFLRDFEYDKLPATIPSTDIHFGEVVWGSWGGVSISDMKFYCDIDIPYNNRIWLKLMLRVPIADRMSDKHHMEIKRMLNQELYDMNIHVSNVSETKNRARLLNLIFNINQILP